MAEKKTKADGAVTIKMPKAKTVDINGINFTLRQSDQDIMAKAASLRDELKAAAASGDVATIVAAIGGAKSWIDEVLGDGALKKLTGGVPVGMTDCIRIAVAIADAAVKAYNTDVAEVLE